MDYGYNWFSISDGPAIIRTPRYERFFSVSIFDMKHNVPAVFVNPEKVILLRRPDRRHLDSLSAENRFLTDDVGVSFR